MAIRYGVDLKITRLLLQIGLMCGDLGKFEEARQILGSFRNFRDDIPHPGTVMALLSVSEGRPEEAEEQLDAVLAAFPDHQLAKALLGLVYREVGRADWRDVLREVIEDGREEWSIRLARTLLGADAPTYVIPRASDGEDHAARMQRLYA